MSESSKQRGHVMAVMLDCKWRTLFELDAELRAQGHIYLTTSVSARLRELRNSEFGGWCVESRKRKGKNARIYEYRVLPPNPPQQQGLFA